jgi:uncharacterized protein YlaI
MELSVKLLKKKPVNAYMCICLRKARGNENDATSDIRLYCRPVRTGREKIDAW